jgi:predicted 3-demethylubiquinone-9 3-methyltransferase (glyoxalase superfamily)
MSAVSHSPLITPFLWFDNNAEEAVRFYTSVFPNSRILTTLPNQPDITPSPGKVLTIAFELDGLPFTALNGGPNFTFNEAVSFVVHCANQQEIDRYWEKLTADGGSEVACGWLKDKFGLSWQVVPRNIGDLVRHPNAMQALMQMKKLDLATLEQAAHK